MRRSRRLSPRERQNAGSVGEKQVKIGVFTALYSDLTLEQVLEKLAGFGVETVELGTGNFPGSAHCDPDVLLGDARALEAFRRAIASSGLTISALSQHGNPLHPRDDVAQAAHRTWLRTVELAERLEVSTVIAFSGCPGDSAGGEHPNWVACAWPDEYPELLEWQWRERVVPYWTEQAGYAAAHGARIAIEPHPGFVVFNTETLLRLRRETGADLGANYDPSHLFWQGIDPRRAIDELAAAGAIFHVHAKDTLLDPDRVASKGVLETVGFERFRERAWNFTTVGDGHGADVWIEIVAALERGGYDGTLSIEHEDPLRGLDEGLERGVRFLRGVLAERQR
jgi:sugar phosphate isomerase/epimerase